MHAAITPTDSAILIRSLNRTAARFGEGMQLTEIGIFKCETTRGIIDTLKPKLKDFTVWGVDSARIHHGDEKKLNPPTEHFKLVLAESTEAHHLLPATLHWVFIDACHCANHAMLDFLNFGSHVPVGGEVLFHDVSPLVEGKFYQRHGPEIPDFAFAVRTAIDRLGLHYRTDWELVEEGWDDNPTKGGVAVFRRTKPHGDPAANIKL